MSNIKLIPQNNRSSADNWMQSGRRYHENWMFRDKAR